MNVTTDLSRTTGETRETMDLQTLEDVARLVAPAGARVHHLCDTGVGTFLVTPQRHGRVAVEYALKVLPESSRAATRPAREFAALSRIDGPHLVNYRETGVIRHHHTDYRWLSMDFVEGTSLAHVLEAGTNLDVTSALRMFEGAVSGAISLWETRIAHRAITPDNLVITPAGDLVLVDLGPSQEVEQTGGDDQSKGASPVDSDSSAEDWLADQFDLGLVGQLLVQSTNGNVSPTGQQVATPESRPRFEETDAARTDMVRVVTKMLATGPADRYRNWADLRSELAEIRNRCVASEARWHLPVDLPSPACRSPRP